MILSLSEQYQPILRNAMNYYNDMDEQTMVWTIFHFFPPKHHNFNRPFSLLKFNIANSVINGPVTGILWAMGQSHSTENWHIDN